MLDLSTLLSVSLDDSYADRALSVPERCCNEGVSRVPLQCILCFSSTPSENSLGMERGSDSTGNGASHIVDGVLFRHVVHDLYGRLYLHYLLSELPQVTAVTQIRSSVQFTTQATYNNPTGFAIRFQALLTQHYTCTSLLRSSSSTL